MNRFIFFFLLISLTFSTSLLPDKLASADLLFHEKITITTDKDISNFRLYLSVPINTSFQQINSLDVKGVDNATLFTQPDSPNLFLLIKISKINSNEPYSFDVFSNLSIRAYEWTDSNCFNINSNLTKYDLQILTFTNLFSYNTSYELASKLLDKTNQLVQYDYSYTYLQENASSVFQNKKGTCDEFSRLYIAMLNSQNISAHEVIGFAFSENGFEPHSFVELCLGHQGIYADPTSKQIYNLDPLHILLYHKKDESTIEKSEFTYEISDGVPNLNIDKQYSITVLSSTQKSNSFIIPKLNYSTNGTVFNIDLNLKNTLNKQEFFRLIIYGPKDIGGKIYDSILTIKPNQNISLSFSQSIYGELKKDYKITYPLIVAIDGLEHTFNLTYISKINKPANYSMLNNTSKHSTNQQILHELEYLEQSIRNGTIKNKEQLNQTINQFDLDNKTKSKLYQHFSFYFYKPKSQAEQPACALPLFMLIFFISIFSRSG